MVSQRRSKHQLSRKALDRARDAQLKRAFLTQAETLNSHEARIARLTEIQTWTNIISGCVTFATTLILIGVAWMSWSASEKQVRLEYAKTANQYSVRAENENREGGSQLPSRLLFALDQKSGSIVRTQVYQQLYAGSDCVATFNDFWVTGQPGELVRSRDFSDSEPVLVGLSGGRAPVYAGPTLIVIQYYDVFGDVKTDLVRLEGGAMEVARDVSSTEANVYSAGGAIVDARFESEDGFLPDECREFAVPGTSFRSDAVENGLNIQPLRVEVLDPHALWDARDAVSSQYPEDFPSSSAAPPEK